MKRNKYIILGEIDIQPLLSTRDFLAEALQVAENKFEVAGTIQAFEICYELAYKTCRKILNLRGTSVYTAKEVFRIVGLDNLISDAET